MRSTLSKSNKYYISKFKFLELKNFCMQYRELKSEYRELSLIKSSSLIKLNRGDIYDKVGDNAVRQIVIKQKLDLIEDTAIEADEALASYILLGVTEDIGYTYLSAKMGIPCSKKTYYNRYHKFFYLLSCKR